MSPESAGSRGPEGANQPDDDWPEDDWPEDDSADDDWPEEDEPGAPWPGGPPGPAYGDGGPRRGLVRPLAITAVAVAAVGVGAGITAAAMGGPSSAPSVAPPTSGTSPQVGVPGGNGANGAFPGGGTGGGDGGGSGARLFIVGKVTAVSSTSITIGGGSHKMTAGVTGPTRVTGQATSIGSVKVGDVVSAQITEGNGQATATAIQDPARMPQQGGGAP